MSDIRKRADKVLTPAWSFHTDLAVRRMVGATVEDTSGRRYLDFSAGLACCNVGYSHPRVLAAVAEQLKAYQHTGGVYYHEPLVRLGEALAETLPGDISMFFFGNSGAEAVEGAIKLARHATGRPGIIAFTGAFHGRTFGALSLTNSSARYRCRYRPLLPEVYHAPFPYCFRCPVQKSRPACATACADYLEQIIFRHLIAPEEVAAIVIEPVQGEGGYIPAPFDFMRRLRALCDRYGMLLVADEVQCGMGRTGKWWGCDHAGVVPDIVAIGKALASGFPLSAVAASPALMERWPPGAHGTTFGGNPLSCAAAVATLAMIKEEGLLEHATCLGQQAMADLAAIQERFSFIGEVRGLGLMIGVEIVDREGRPDGQKAGRIREACLTRGLVVIECGLEKHVLRLAPPLNLTCAEWAEGLGILASALEQVCE